IVDKTTWDDVQRQLQARSQGKKCPRNPCLWLSGLVKCSRCRQVMDGSGKVDPPALDCRNYRKFGPENKTGCRLHRTPHRVIEEFVFRYLQEAGLDVKLILSAREDRESLAVLHERLDTRESEAMAILGQMKSYVDVHGEVCFDYRWDGLTGLVEVYEA